MRQCLSTPDGSTSTAVRDIRNGRATVACAAASLTHLQINGKDSIQLGRLCRDELPRMLVGHDNAPRTRPPEVSRKP